MPLVGIVMGSKSDAPFVARIATALDELGVAHERRVASALELARAACEMFEGRVMLRSQLLKSILPPVAFVMIAIAVGLIVTGLFLPLFALIQGLT